MTEQSKRYRNSFSGDITTAYQVCTEGLAPFYVVAFPFPCRGSYYMPQEEFEVTWLELEKEVKVNFAEEGGGIITPTVEGFRLHSIPQYGGEPSLEGVFKTLKEAEDIANSWT